MQTILQMTLSIIFQYGCAVLLQNSTQNAFTRKTDPPRCSKARFGSFLPPARREGSQGPVTGGQSTLLAVVDLGQDLAGARRGKTKHSKMQISGGFLLKVQFPDKQFLVSAELKDDNFLKRLCCHTSPVHCVYFPHAW